jgi:hypothetical protein
MQLTKRCGRFVIPRGSALDQLYKRITAGEERKVPPSKEKKGITTLRDDNYEYHFGRSSKTARRRAERLLQKEKGTIAWLDRELGPNDVFFDIGANIGIYTIFGAKRINGTGMVVAFEPHIPSANSLI